MQGIAPSMLYYWDIPNICFNMKNCGQHMGYPMFKEYLSLYLQDTVVIVSPHPFT